MKHPLWNIIVIFNLVLLVIICFHTLPQLKETYKEKVRKEAIVRGFAYYDHNDTFKWREISNDEN